MYDNCDWTGDDMIKYLVNLEYDGSEFNGYATQPNRNTIQDNIEMVLSKIFQSEIKTFGSSRTDARVHARDQYLTFEVEKNIEPRGLLRALNAQTKPAINIKNVEIVNSDFNPRYHVKSKVYHYQIMTKYNPFLRRYAYYHPYKLNIDKMREATKFICGTHDFTSFCNVKSEVEDKIRTIYELTINETDELITIEIEGNGFLYNMVRIIAGVLIDVGTEKIEPKQVSEMLLAKNRTVASKTMPPEGLFLIKINY